jgi:hypothetical protein
MRLQPPAGVEGQSWILYLPNREVLIGKYSKYTHTDRYLV